MLNDIERKMLRVIANFSAGRRRMPTIKELCVKTGRSRSGVISVLAILAHHGFIEWSKERPEEMELLLAWEPGQKKTTAKINLPYGRR